MGSSFRSDHCGAFTLHFRRDPGSLLVSTLTMGGGNGCKSAMAKQRKSKKNQKSKALSTHSKEHQKLAAANICQICRQSFPNTAKEATLKAHVDAKHSGKCPKPSKNAFQHLGPP